MGRFYVEPSVQTFHGSNCHRRKCLRTFTDVKFQLYRSLPPGYFLHSEEMQCLHAKIHQQYINAMAAYRKSNDHLPLRQVCEGTATRPAISDMLEWLLDLDLIFQYLYP